ncbi:hypothetical protein BGZ82_002410 [Podila clonocystis]|nr:hypothetical protein BGZ82_002410 [Podila clonocystis]
MTLPLKVEFESNTTMSFSAVSPCTILRNPCHRTQEFIFDWPVEASSSVCMSQVYHSGADQFTLRVNRQLTFDISHTFILSPRITFAYSYTIKTPSGSCLASGPLEPNDPENLDQRRLLDFHVMEEKILQSRLEVINGRYQVNLSLSSQRYVVSAPPQAVVAPRPVAPSPAVSFLDRLYHDVHDRDVAFIFNNPGLESTSEITIERAHKLVLDQWSYFNHMFRSDFMEGGVGDEEIQVKDVTPQVFQLLLRFMYTGVIPHGEQPTITFSDSLTNPQEASWEDVFLAAHRYELEELCELAQKKILEKLTTKATIPFLFRTGYLFDSFRADAYQDHPEFGGLLFELFEACHGSK